MKSDIDKNLMPLSIRRLDLENDFPLVYEWLKGEYVNQDNPAEFSCQSLLEAYQSIADSSFAESCMVWSGDATPVMEVDICEGDMHEIYPFYDAKPKDFVLRPQFPPQKDLPLIESGLRLVFQYCFTEWEAKKLIVPVYVKDEFQKSLFIKLGFTCYTKDLYKNIYSLYVLTR